MFVVSAVNVRALDAGTLGDQVPEYIHTYKDANAHTHLWCPIRSVKIFRPGLWPSGRV